MLLRIVRMSFDPHKAGNFPDYFTTIKPDIEAFDGCQKVDIYRDAEKDHVYYTVSIWQDRDSLEIYRQSNIFRGRWEIVTQWFDEKPQAWSLTGIDLS